MNKSDAVKLQQLADRNFWDIEILWDRFDLDIKVLERFDAEGFIELREVGLYQDSNTTMRTKEGPWYSPLSKSKSWSYYFPRDNDDRKMRTSRQEILPPEQRLIFTMFNSAPVEVRVTEAGRRALIQHRTGSAISNTATKKRKRKASLIKQARNLTKIELNTLTTVAKYCGNYALAAKELGKDPSTVRMNHSRALKKSARQNPQSRSVSAKAYPTNARGQQDI